MHRLELLQRVLAIGASLFGLVSGLAFLLAPEADEARFRHFALFLVRSAMPDLVVIAATCALAWIGVRLTRQILVRNPGGSPSGSATGRRALFVGVLAITALGVVALAVPFYFLGRARWFYWTQLSRSTYAMRDLTRIERLARTGRIEQAYRLATRAQKVLAETPEDGLFSRAVLVLGSRVNRSRMLSSNLSIIAARSWNPLTHRQRYFELAEAVRLNPEDYASADALRIMRAALIERALPAEGRAVCSSDGLARRRHTLMPLEAEIRAERLRATNGAANAVTNCITSISAPWSLVKVGCILAISARTRQPFTRREEKAWSPASLGACRGVPMDDSLFL